MTATSVVRLHGHERRSRLIKFAIVLMLLGGLVVVAAPQTALAVQSKPLTNWSYYVLSISTGDAYNLGCNQGHSDTNNGHTNSEVVLDFGGQQSNGSGTRLAKTVTDVTNAQIETYAEEFSHGYFFCTGASNYTSKLYLGVGTNNSYYDVSYSGGQVWGQVINAVQSYNQSYGYSGQVIVRGANDMEPAWDTATNTRAWAGGFDAATGATYINYGSADDCPTNTSNNGGCANGWHQTDVWYVSWGAPPALALPEIYYSGYASQWAMISLYGAQYQSDAIRFEGPLDEYDLASGTNTSEAAWTQLWTDINNNPLTAKNLTYSAQIHDSTNP